MTYFEAIILGIVQGLAEFLPISSSGHLSIIENLMGIDEDSIMFFAVLLHMGTLISVFVVFWKDIRELIQELILTINDLCRHKGLRLDERPVRKLGVMIIVSCIPTAIIGFLFEDTFSVIYTKPALVGVMFAITGFILYAADTWGGGSRTLNELNYRNTVFIGIVQGLACIPGISRSGSTLFASLMCKLEREFAVRFVFLISIPPILGSFILELPDGIKQGMAQSDWGPAIVGVIVSFLSGLFAIKIMLKVVTNNKLKYFSVYMFIIALITIIISIF